LSPPSPYTTLFRSPHENGEYHVELRLGEDLQSRPHGERVAGRVDGAVDRVLERHTREVDVTRADQGERLVRRADRDRVRAVEQGGGPRVGAEPLQSGVVECSGGTEEGDGDHDDEPSQRSRSARSPRGRPPRGRRRRRGRPHTSPRPGPPPAPTG